MTGSDVRALPRRPSPGSRKLQTTVLLSRFCRDQRYPTSSKSRGWGWPDSARNAAHAAMPFYSAGLIVVLPPTTHPPKVHIIYWSGVRDRLKKESEKEGRPAFDAHPGSSSNAYEWDSTFYLIRCILGGLGRRDPRCGRAGGAASSLACSHLWVARSHP